MNKILNPSTKPCLICSKIMENVRRDRKYCSSICSRKSSHYTSFKNCLHCKKEMKNIHGHQKFCSTECYSKLAFERRKGRLLNESYRQKTNFQQREKRKEVQFYIRNYKISKGCIDCGFNKHHSALQFDHVRGEKIRNVCHSKSIDSAKIEIEKCEVVCANCHSIRSFERIQKKGYEI